MSQTESPQVWTHKALMEWTTKYLHTKGIEAPLKVARMLLAHVLGCQPIDVVARSDEEATNEQRSRFKELIRRRVEGCPTAYLTGKRDFYMLSFQVSPAVLIPRPDTEILVVQAVDVLKTNPTAKVLDLGTGSGCIVISLAHQAKQARFTAVDISPDALEIAQRNAATHGMANRIDFHLGDLFAALPMQEKFHLIVSNPPYIPPSEIATLSIEVREYEPRLALDGGPDGLAFYRRLAQEAPAWLEPNGQLIVEIGWSQGDAVAAILEQTGWQDVRIIKDLEARSRVVSAKRA